MVRQCRYVDEVYEGCPWNITEEFLQEMEIDYVCHDEIPYTSIESDDSYAIPKRLGKFKATKRTAGVSTTDIVGKILKNKENYYYRNMSRGASREELGLSMPVYWFYRFKKILCPAVQHEK